MAEFVLVPGAWLGAWSWSKVVPGLEEDGHAAYPVTLTGVAERDHLASPDVGMETGIRDVLNVIKYNDLREVVLVGHSFAGKVAAAVADRAADRIRTTVYLDGFVPEKVRIPQGAFPDEFPVEGSMVPFPESFVEAVGKVVRGDDRKWLLSLASPLPVRYLRDPITLSAAYDSVARSYIYCTGGDTLAWFLSQSPGRSAEEVLKEKLDGPYRLIDTGHYPMITRPKELAKDLIALAGTRA